MYLKYLFIIVSTSICASAEVSAKSPGDSCSLIDNNFQVQVFENFGYVKQSLNDLYNRLDAVIDNSRNKQQSIDKQSFDDLKTQLDALTNSLKAKQEKVDSKIEKLESQQKVLIQENLEMKGNYSNLLHELNTIKLSEKSFKEQYIDLEEKYLELLNNKENDIKSKNDLNLRIDNITTQLSNILAHEAYDKKTLFDVRVDKLPEFNKVECNQDSEPIDCKAATKCTQKSGYYKIYLPGNKAKQIMVYCDMEIAGGNWMHILRRIDGSENFNRNWTDYVNGFGKVESEYWIGLENLYALTQNNGRQTLYVHLETVPGVSSYAFYNNFLIGGATEIYKLKYLGSYEGTAVDGLSYAVEHKFSTFDYDNDNSSYRNCAADNGGFWHANCGYAKPTGDYIDDSGVRWDSKESRIYRIKIMYLMIKQI